MSVMVKAAHLLTGDEEYAPGWVEIKGSDVAATGPGRPPRDADITLDHGTLAPGLIDAQLNGAYGVDLAGADLEGWLTVVRRLPETGVTAFVPTFITAELRHLTDGLRRYAALRPEIDQVKGAARTLGVHVEGPFLAPAQRGAHRADLLRDPEPDQVRALLDAGRDGTLRYLTLAPELPGALTAIRTATQFGVRVAVGHSDADADAVHAAARAGATLITHLFNAQRALHHRSPGVVGAALTDRRLTCGLIADGHHVHTDAVKVAFTAAPGRIMLVTDGVAALGMPPGTYELGGETIVTLQDHPPMRADGTIAGASGRLDDGIAFAVDSGVPLAEAVAAATTIPADALGVKHLGRIAAGRPADLVWLAPTGTRTLRTKATWIAGGLSYCTAPVAPAEPSRSKSGIDGP